MKRLLSVLSIVMLFSMASMTVAQQTTHLGSWDFSTTLEQSFENATGFRFAELLAANDLNDVSKVRLYQRTDDWIAMPETLSGEIIGESIPLQEAQVKDILREHMLKETKYGLATALFAPATPEHKDAEKKDTVKTSVASQEEPCDCTWSLYTQKLTFGPLYNEPFVRICPNSKGVFSIPKQLLKEVVGAHDGIAGIELYIDSLYAYEFFSGMVKDERDKSLRQIRSAKKAMTAYAGTPSQESCEQLKTLWPKGVLSAQQLETLDQGWYYLDFREGAMFALLCHCRPGTAVKPDEPVTTRAAEAPQKQAPVKTEGRDVVGEQLQALDRMQQELLFALAEQDTDDASSDDLSGRLDSLEKELLEALEQQSRVPDTVRIKDSLPTTYPVRIITVGIGARWMAMGGPHDEDLYNGVSLPSLQLGFGMLFNSKKKVTAGIGLDLAYVPDVDYYRWFVKDPMGPYVSYEVSYTRDNGSMIGGRLKGYFMYRNAVMLSVGAGIDHFHGFEEVVVETITDTRTGTTQTATYPGEQYPDLELDARLTGVSLSFGADVFLGEHVLLGLRADMTRYVNGWQYVGSSSGSPALQGDALAVDNGFGLQGCSVAVTFVF